MNSNKRTKAVITGLFLMTSLVAANAALIDTQKYKNDLLIDDSDFYHPMLRAAIAPEDSSSSGEFVIACQRKKISVFSFNIILKYVLDKSIVEYNWNNIKIFIGVRKSSENSKNINTLNNYTYLNKYIDIIEPRFTITQKLTPYDISDTGTVFLSKNVDAKFLQAIIDGDELVIARKYPSETQYRESWSTYYKVIPDYITRFMSSCTSDL